MALQTSGMISLNDIHIEAGGTTGTSVSINDSDLRGLTAGSGYTIPTGSGTAIEFGDFYGASAGWSMTLTQGNFQGKFCFKSCSYWPMYGYALYETYSSGAYNYMKSIPATQTNTDLVGTNAVTHGSLSDTTFDTISNSVIVGLYWDTGLVDSLLYFSIKGHHANSGWTTLTIGSNTFNRADATHDQAYGGSTSGEQVRPRTTWFWGATNPFSTTDGTTHTVTIA